MLSTPMLAARHDPSVSVPFSEEIDGQADRRDCQDLPLDYNCAELRNQIEQYISRLREVPEEGDMFS